MKETGIIMLGNHPKLILDEIKTQSRRVIKPQPFKAAWNATAEHPSYGWFWKQLYQTWDGEDDFFRQLVELSPYGQVGDRLWVRETFAYLDTDNTHSRADAPVWYWVDGNPDYGNWTKPKPSIHMFRKDSRIDLEITEVRVERLQEISEEDAKSEGCSMILGNMDRPDTRWYFKNLWDSLNAKRKVSWNTDMGTISGRGYGWEVNPWVWVISFKLIGA